MANATALGWTAGLPRSPACAEHRAGRAGITSYDGSNFHSHQAMGHVAGNFDRDEVMRGLPGRTAIGHVRYSTTGETSLRNVQPLFAELAEVALRSPRTATSPTP